MINTADSCSPKTLSTLSYHQLQGKGTKLQLTVSIDPFMTDILQSYIPPHNTSYGFMQLSRTNLS